MKGEGNRPPQGVSQGLLEAGVPGSWVDLGVSRGGEGMLGRGATGGRQWRERLQWVGVAGALGQAVASGDGAGAGLRRPTRLGVGHWVAGPSAERRHGHASGAAGPAG